MSCNDYFCQEHRECVCAGNGIPEFAESSIHMFDTEESRGRVHETFRGYIEEKDTARD